MLQKADGADDPNRCQGVFGDQQCQNKAVQLPDGTYGKFCLTHGGNRAIEAANKAAIRLYNLGKYQAQLEQQADHSNIKSLREEIGILRIVLQENFTLINNSTDLILHSGRITDIIMKIEKLVASCHKLEGSMGQLLDKQAILSFASQVVSIISEELVGQEDIMQKIGDKIIRLVGNIDDESD